MHEALKKRVENLEKDADPIVTPRALEIMDLLRQHEEFIEHPERFPPEDPDEERAMLEQFLKSDEARMMQKMKVQGRIGGE